MTFREYIRPHVFDNSAQVAQEAARQIMAVSKEAIAKRGRFKLVLAGGSTPQATYQLLVGAKTDWSKWHIYFGDERCLPVDDPDRNSHMATAAWLSQVAIPSEQIFFIKAELCGEAAASDYQQQIAEALPFDMVLLGMGEDGHTASLFPGHKHNESELVVPVHDAPKPPSDRVSLNAAALCKTQAMVIMVTGAGKHPALQAWQRGEPLPVAALHPLCGVELLLDRAAIEG